MTHFRFSLRQLQYLLAAAESSTLSEAAERLNASPAALSEALRILEAELGTQIFVRRKALGISLTRAGSELAIHARGVIASAEQFQMQARGELANLTGRVVLGCYTTLAPFILPRLIEALNRSYPGIYVEIFEGSADAIQGRLHEGRCDAAMLYDFDLGPNTASDELFRLKPQIILPEGHWLAEAAEVDLVDLENEPFIQFGEPPAPQTMAPVFEEVGATPRITHRIKNYELIRAMVARNLGYSLMFHRPRIATSLEGLGIIVKPIARTRMQVGIVLVRSAHIQLSPRMQELWSFFRQVLTE